MYYNITISKLFMKVSCYINFVVMSLHFRDIIEKYLMHL